MQVFLLWSLFCASSLAQVPEPEPTPILSTQLAEQAESGDLKGPDGWKKRFFRQETLGNEITTHLPQVPENLDEYWQLGNFLNLKVGGRLQVDWLGDIGEVGNLFTFSPAQIPVNGDSKAAGTSGFVSLGPGSRISSRSSRLHADFYTPFPERLEGLRFYFEGDFQGRDGSLNLRHAFVRSPFFVIEGLCRLG